MVNIIEFNGKIVEIDETRTPNDEDHYSTLNFIEDLVRELGISQKKVSELYFGKNPRYLEARKSLIKNKKTPDFTFDKETLAYLEERLIEDAQNCLCLVEKYKNANPNLKGYSWQQYHLHESDLKADYFKTIDSKDKAYWYGFLCADGYIANIKEGRKKYDIGVELSIKDENQLKRFCEYLGLNPLQKIKKRKRIDEIRGSLVTYWRARVVFTCKPMHEDLRAHSFASSKTLRKDAPKFDNEELMLAWLLGYYDGDGTQGQTDICSASEQFLKDIKRKFNIKNEVREYETRVEDLKDLDSGSVVKQYIYRLRLGPNIFNKMMDNYLDSMPRKRNHFKDNCLEILKEKIGSDEKLQELAYKFRRFELIELFDTSKHFLDKLIKDWEISLPPNGYWKGKPYNYSGKKKS